MSWKRAAAALGAIVVGSAAASVPATAGGSTSTIGVRNGVEEFSFFLSRTTVDPGPAIVQYQNTGEDPHDLKFKRRGDNQILAVGELLPGGVGSISPRLKPSSRYELWCSLDGHREAGMEAVLKVRQRRSG